MISDVVNNRSEATVIVDVRSDSGRSLSLGMVIDTGFNGTVALAEEFVEALGLAPAYEQNVRFADGMFRVARYFWAIVEWVGIELRAAVLQLPEENLVGTQLLDGRRLEANWTSGGAVRITPL